MNVKNEFNTIFKALFPTFFLGVAAAFQLYAINLYLHQQNSFLIIILFFLVTSGIYLINRVVDKEDKFNNINRWNFFNKSPLVANAWLFLSSIFIISPFLILLFLNSIKLSIIFLCIAILGLAYSIKIIPIPSLKSYNWISLKDIPILKNIIVCILWGGSALLVSVFSYTKSYLQVFDLIVILITFSITALSGSVGADSRDIEGDKIRGLITLPILLGEIKTCYLLELINVYGIVSIVCLLVAKTISPVIAFFGIFCICWAGITIFTQTMFTNRISRIIKELLVDSPVIMQAIGLFLIYKIL